MVTNSLEIDAQKEATNLTQDQTSPQDFSISLKISYFSQVN